MLYAEPHLENVDPRLVAIARSVSERMDILVCVGARTIEQEQQAIASGHSKLHDPLKSKHVITPERPLAMAIDLAPYPVNWEDIPAFQALADVVKEVAAEQGTPIVWGGDWVHFKDMDHFQLPDDA